MVLLKEANQVIDQIARPMRDRSLVLGLMLTLGVTILFVYSYISYVRVSGVKYGVIHGAYFGVLAGLLVDLNQYLLYPIPGSLVGMWFVFGFAEFCIYGALVSWLYPINDRQYTSANTRT